MSSIFLTKRDLLKSGWIPSKSKYNAQPTWIDEIRFDSIRESQRYAELKLQERVSEISSLEIQPEFELHAFNNSKEPIGKYIADFMYRDKDNAIVVEDVKGVITPLAKWKIKHFEIQYKIKVRIVK